jgi:UDP-glucuronate 4-epimerase
MKGKSMNVLVTGSEGFIGKHLVRSLQDINHKVITHNGVKSFENVNIDAMIHLAAVAGIRPDKQDAFQHYNDNILQTLTHLDSCVRYGIPKFVFVSSSSVYGNSDSGPFSETDNTDKPLCHYAATKKAGELACYTYHYLHGLDIACVRPFTVYGPGQKTEMAIPLFTKQILFGKKLSVFGNGNTLRDYVYVQDVVDGIIGTLSINHGYEIYNLGSEKASTTLELIRLIENRLGKKANSIEFDYNTLGEARYTYSNNFKAKIRFGYSPKVDIVEGIDKYITWYLKEISNAV